MDYIPRFTAYKMSMDASVYYPACEYANQDVVRVCDVIKAIRVGLVTMSVSAVKIDNKYISVTSSAPIVVDILTASLNGWRTLIGLSGTRANSVKVGEKILKYQRQHSDWCTSTPAMMLTEVLSLLKKNIYSKGVDFKRSSECLETILDVMMDARCVISCQLLECGLKLPAHPMLGGFILNVCDRCAGLSTSLATRVGRYASDTGLMPNYRYRSLLALRRCRMYTGDVDIGSVFTYGLSAYLSLMTDPLAKHLSGLITEQVQRICVNTPGMFVDDAVRQYLSAVDKVVFTACSGSTPVCYILSCFHGLATVGGPRSWSVETLFQSISEWVSNKDDKLRHPDALLLEQELVEKWTAAWCGNRLGTTCITFEVFCSDLNKWATSGGGPRSKIDIGRDQFDLKTKWAWGFEQLMNGKDVYVEACKMKPIARVALKEESKTRTVITTPMASYLRQCYLLYVLGNPTFLDSTIGSTEHVQVLAPYRYAYYICVDASKFDHCVSKQFIIMLFTALRNSLSAYHKDLGLAELIDAEINEINSLTVEFDNKELAYEGGLLSGWKWTSLIGSMKSDLLCAYINKRLGVEMRKIVQGDDIIMMSDRYYDVSMICGICEEFGITTNPLKTTVSDVGEFLKYRYGPRIISAYPARTVRSIYLANPWLDSSSKSSAGAVHSKWMALASRLALGLNDTSVVAKCIDYAREDVVSWSGGSIGKNVYNKLLKTPTNAGGFGYVEFMDVSTDREITSIREPEHGMPYERQFLSMLGIVPVEASKRVVVDVKTSYVTYIHNAASARFSGLSPVSRLSLRKDCNAFKTILALYLHFRDSKVIKRVYDNSVGLVDKCVFNDKMYPMYLRKTRNFMSKIKYILFPDDISVPDSLFLDNRYSATLTRYMTKYTRAVLTSCRQLTVSRTKSLAMSVAREYLCYRTIIHSA